MIILYNSVGSWTVVAVFFGNLWNWSMQPQVWVLGVWHSGTMCTTHCSVLPPLVLDPCCFNTPAITTEVPHERNTWVCFFVYHYYIFSNTQNTPSHTHLSSGQHHEQPSFNNQTHLETPNTKLNYKTTKKVLLEHKKCLCYLMLLLCCMF